MSTLLPEQSVQLCALDTVGLVQQTVSTLNNIKERLRGHTRETTSGLLNKQELEQRSQVGEYQTAELPLESVSVRQTSSGQNSNSLESSIYCLC